MSYLDEDSYEDDEIPSPGITSRMQEIILNSFPDDARPTLGELADALFSDSDSDSDSNSDSDSDIEIMYSSPYREKTEPVIKADIPIKTYFVALKPDQRAGGCTICMNGFKKNDNIVRLRCRDVFHSKCYASWSENSYRCPKCLKSVDDYRAQVEFDQLERAIEEASDDEDSVIVIIRCIDCESEIEDVKNPIKNRCNVCGSYNTTY